MWKHRNFPGAIQVVFTLPWESWESTAFALSPDSTLIALGGYDSKVRIWQSSDVNNSLPQNEPVKTFEIAGNDSFSSLAFSPNGEWLAGGTTSGAVYVWQLSDGKILYSMQANLTWCGNWYSHQTAPS